MDLEISLAKNACLELNSVNAFDKKFPHLREASATERMTAGVQQI